MSDTDVPNGHDVCSIARRTAYSAQNIMNITPRQVHLTLKQALEDGTDEKLTEQAQRFREEGFGWRYDGRDLREAARAWR